MPDIAFVKPALPKTGVLVLPLTEGDPPAGLAQQADEATGGVLTRALEAAGFKGRKGQSCTIWAPASDGGGPASDWNVGTPQGPSRPPEMHVKVQARKATNRPPGRSGRSKSSRHEQATDDSDLTSGREKATDDSE
jgi:hypothetical protein